MEDENIARAVRGSDIIDWNTAKAAFADRLAHVLKSWDHDETIQDLTFQITSFPAPPHTVQRLAELLDSPGTHYSDPDKYVRAVKRVLSVSSTVLDFPMELEPVHEIMDDALLVPIPWLSARPGNGIESRAGSIGGEATEMGMVTVATGQGAGGHETSAVPAPMGGSAPMDAADFGPQAQAVVDGIEASNGGHGPHSPNHSSHGSRPSLSSSLQRSPPSSYRLHGDENGVLEDVQMDDTP